MPPVTEKNYQDLLDRIEQAKQEKSEAAGAKAELMKRAKELGFNSIEEIEDEIARLKRLIPKKEREAEAEFVAIKKELDRQS